MTKLNVSKEWCMKMAKLEGDAEVGAGALARDPVPTQCETCLGEGKLEIPAPQRDDPHYARVVACIACDGNGWV